MKAFVQRKCKSTGQDSSSRISPSTPASKHGRSTPSQVLSRRNIFSPSILVSHSPFSSSRTIESDASPSSSMTEEPNNPVSSTKNKPSGFKWLLERRKSTPPIKMSQDKGAGMDVAGHELLANNSCKASNALAADSLAMTENAPSWDVTLAIREEEDGLVEREVQEHGSSTGFMQGSKHHFMSLFRLTSSRSSVSPPNRLQSPDSVATVTSISSGMGGPSPMSRGNSPGSAAHVSAVLKEKFHGQQLQHPHVDSHQKLCPVATNSPDSGLEDGGRRSTGLFIGEYKPNSCSTEIVVEEDYSIPLMESFHVSSQNHETRVIPIHSEIKMRKSRIPVGREDGIPASSSCVSVASSSSDLDNWAHAQSFFLPEHHSADFASGQRATFYNCKSPPKEALRKSREDAGYAIPSSINDSTSTPLRDILVKSPNVRPISSIDMIEREEVTPTNPMDGNPGSKRSSLSTVGTPKSILVQESVFTYLSTKDASQGRHDLTSPGDCSISKELTKDVFDMGLKKINEKHLGEDIHSSQVPSSFSSAFQPITIFAQERIRLAKDEEVAMLIHSQTPPNIESEEVTQHSSPAPPTPPARMSKVAGISPNTVSSPRPQGAIAILRHHPASPFSPLPPRSTLASAQLELLSPSENSLVQMDAMHLNEEGFLSSNAAGGSLDVNLHDPRAQFTREISEMTTSSLFSKENLITHGIPSNMMKSEIFTPFQNMSFAHTNVKASEVQQCNMPSYKSNSTEQLHRNGSSLSDFEGQHVRMVTSVEVQKPEAQLSPICSSNIYQRQWSAPIATSVEEKPSGSLLTITAETKEMEKPLEDGPSSDSCDSWSTADSYEEPWDVRHRRMIQELTSSRLLDPSSIRPVPCGIPRPNTETPKAVPANTTLSNPSVIADAGIRETDVSLVFTPATFTEVRQVSTAPKVPSVSHCSVTSQSVTVKQISPDSTKEIVSSSLRGVPSSAMKASHVACTSVAPVSLSTQQLQQRRPESGPYETECYSSEINISLPLEEQYWYHGDVSRSKAEELLQSVALGGFLVRRSETNPSAYSLSIRHHQGYLHMIISRVASTQRVCPSSSSSSMSASHPSSTLFILGQHSQPFPSVPVMMRHYQHHILPIRGADAITLGEPVIARLQVVNRTREHSLVMVPQSRRRRE